MTRRPSRGERLTADLSAQVRQLKAKRAEAVARFSVQGAADSDALEARRAELRRGRANLDPATIARLRRPS
jgi:hypothetical protein